MAKRWPLHPRPPPWDTLEAYVRQLAACYGVRYESFCWRVLGIPLADDEARRFHHPSPDQLQRLSDGTGIPADQLEQMALPRLWAQLLKEAEEMLSSQESHDSR